jgi:anti-sigma factor RsiW
MSGNGNSPEEMDDLVAYLDGELDHDSTQRIERRMGQDPMFRQRLQQMQRAWDLLDVLPRAQAGESFARTTVEIVALRASQEVQQQVEHKQRQNVLAWVLGGAVIAVSAAASFVATSSYLGGPEKQFLIDLPVIERVDEYQWIDSIEFLKMLDEQDVFPEEASDAG